MGDFGTHDFTMASRKAEEAAWRRFEAVRWLENIAGPLGISNQPSESEFISCLRNGLVLCNAINKIQPGAVPKVVESQSITREAQPLTAYQYFENVRNFLVAVEELKLPAFEACDLERDTLDAGSTAKVVDCVLALKAFHEWKQISSRNGFHKFAKSPLIKQSGNRMQSKPIPSDSYRRLDMSTTCDRQPPFNGDTKKLEEEALVGSIAKLLAESMIGSKENIDGNLLASFRNGAMDPVRLFGRLVSNCLEGNLQNKVPELQSVLKDSSIRGRDISQAPLTPEPLEDVALENSKCCKACLRKGNCRHRELIQMQGKELTNLKDLFSRTKKEFEDLQSHLQRDLKHLGTEVQELSTAALGYHKVVKENRKLYNMVMDLKGNIRVYCRIRPSFIAEANSVIDFVGEDGSLVLLDLSKKDGRRVFNFNRVFGPTSTQDEIFEDTQPLIRSVMDGYNVCIFAYGQTGSGKTYTMSGPSDGSTDMGINYLALNDLFQISNGRKDIVSYEIRVQMVEIYNEQVRDLLAEDSATTKLEIRSCPSDNGLTLPDATMHTVKSTADVLNFIRLGEMNRFMSSTAMNNRSSRSHSILTVHVQGKDASGANLRSCLHLVDLAGSERVDKSEVTGDRLKEAQYINKSLSCLGDVITALAQKNSHIPYRNSKLTLLLQDSLGGNAKTLMLAHVSPEEDSFSETISTLKFAQRVSTVELGAARSNKESNEVIQLKQQIESLKKALANKELQSVQYSKTCEKPRPVIDRTPPRPRRLSIENCDSVKSERTMNTERSKTPTLPTRSRRLSLEGPKSINKDTNPRINGSDNSRRPEEVLLPKYGQTQDVEAVTKSFGNFSNGISMLETSRRKDPRSPTSLSYQKRVIKTDSRTPIPHLQLPKTPESVPRSRNESQLLYQNDSTLSTDYQTPNMFSSTSGKGSQIRRSLRTIGKLINGSEKKNHQNMIEAQSIKFSSNIYDGKSPTSASNSKTLRRQSLTGGQPDKNRRSSLGGKTEENVPKDTTRNAKTPPPVRQSTKSTKRWA